MTRTTLYAENWQPTAGRLWTESQAKRAAQKATRPAGSRPPCRETAYHGFPASWHGLPLSGPRAAKQARLLDRRWACFLQRGSLWQSTATTSSTTVGFALHQTGRGHANLLRVGDSRPAYQVEIGEFRRFVVHRRMLARIRRMPRIRSRMPSVRCVLVKKPLKTPARFAREFWTGEIACVKIGVKSDFKSGEMMPCRWI